MATPNQTRPTAATGTTHLQGRAIGKSFRRSGLQFEQAPRWWLLADLKREWGADYDAKLKAVLNERQVVARVCTVGDLDEGARPGIEELQDENTSLRAKVAELEARLTVLEAPKG